MALALSYLMLGQKLLDVQYLFCAMIITGLVLVVWSNYRQEKLDTTARYITLERSVNESSGLSSSVKSTSSYQAIV